jgi:hypothetical protein
MNIAISLHPHNQPRPPNAMNEKESPESTMFAPGGLAIYASTVRREV